MEHGLAKFAAFGAVASGFAGALISTPHPPNIVYDPLWYFVVYWEYVIYWGGLFNIRGRD